MRIVTGNDIIINKMITGDNEIIFNLIFLIRSDKNAAIFTDDRSYIVAQTNLHTPIWIYLNDRADMETENELVQILSDLIEKNKNVWYAYSDEELNKILTDDSTFVKMYLENSKAKGFKYDFKDGKIEELYLLFYPTECP